MPTKYQSRVSNSVKLRGEKNDLIKNKSKASRMEDVHSMLEQAKKLLEEKIADKDKVGADKVREKIALLEGTIKRQK